MRQAPYPEMREIVLNRLRVAVSAVVDPTYVERQANPDVFFTHISDRMIAQLRSEVLAQKLVDDEYEITCERSVAATWWDHFKLQYSHTWLLGWLQRRWPANKRRIKRTHTVHLTRYATYPEAGVQLPDEFGNPVLREVVHLESGDWSDTGRERPDAV